jgi:hypothetical protein
MFGIGSILSSIFGWVIARFGRSTVKITLLISYFTISWGFILTIFYFLISGFTMFYDLVKNALNLSNSLFSSDGSCIGQSISYGLSCLGVIDGLNASIPILFLSLIFLALVLLNNIVLKVRKIMDSNIRSLINLI